jgi:SAM-dependent methyltransferase
MDQKTIDYYARNALSIGDRYESIVNSLALDFERAFLVGSRVLDVGCGSGRDMAYLHRIGRQVFGIDATREFVELAQRLHPELQDRIACGSLPDAEVPFGGEFDGVLCSAVLMHVPLTALPDTVTFIKRCLRLGGHLLYSVPSKRLDVIGESQRDSSGRLFIPDDQGRLQALLTAAGFILVDSWSNNDSLGRDEVEWASALMSLETR